MDEYIGGLPLSSDSIIRLTRMVNVAVQVPFVHYYEGKSLRSAKMYDLEVTFANDMN